MVLYGVDLVALAFLNIALAYHQYIAHKQEPAEESLALPSGEDKAAAARFKWEYFSLYGLVMAADWLQVSQQTTNNSIQHQAKPCLLPGSFYVYLVQGRKRHC